ncbi:zinc ribbon domain-containing protein [Methanospirillum lacunae]|uniref:Zinc-ribbon domain-containing protein n=1 Tax=Methanospirillum lacunae TaxID=668570 RepID=A0A2V2MZA3_9EURY|nr:zinc ribbon domain-containing protein [Methanospirillum lacunae]PWR72799.1 hypothetical protein DK846_07570 [Methanospirillum lacunae]
MSILDNIKGPRSGDDGDPNGGKFNPFKLLDIGEIMVRYTDGIKIKDFVFLSVLTSERLILIDSTKQGSGQIAKEIPFSVIKLAELERDERDRPTLAISMEVGGQHRVMRLVFTGLINEPETECREWFTAINGYPPERIEKQELRLDEPATPPVPEQRPYPTAVEQQPVSVPPPVSYNPPPVSPIPPAPTLAPEIKQPIPQPAPVTYTPIEDEIRTHEPVQPPTPVYIPSHQQEPIKPALRAEPVHVVPKASAIPSAAKRVAPSIPVQEGSVRILIEKPDISPIRIRAEPIGEKQQKGSTSWKYCIQCGSRIPSQSRFCQSCGSQQT